MLFVWCVCVCCHYLRKRSRARLSRSFGPITIVNLMSLEISPGPGNCLAIGVVGVSRSLAIDFDAAAPLLFRSFLNEAR